MWKCIFDWHCIIFFNTNKLCPHYYIIILLTTSKITYQYAGICTPVINALLATREILISSWVPSSASIFFLVHRQMHICCIYIIIFQDTWHTFLFTGMIQDLHSYSHAKDLPLYIIIFQDSWHTFLFTGMIQDLHSYTHAKDLPLSIPNQVFLTITILQHNT